MAIKPLAPKAKTQTRHFVIDGLVGRGVDDKEVKAAGHRSISGGLQDSGAVHKGTIAEAIRGKGLSGSHILTIDMGHRGRLAYVALVLWNGNEVLLVAHPYRGHRNVSIALTVHTVCQVGPPCLVTLRVPFQSVRPKDIVELVIMVLAHHVANGGAPVKEEALGLINTIDDDARERWEPGKQVVTTARLKLLCHTPCPGLTASLVAIIEQMGDAALTQQALAGIDIGLQIILVVIADGHGIQFVYLQTGSLGRGGMIGLARKAIAEAHDTPATLGSLPGEYAILDHRGNVDDIAHANHIGGSRGLDRGAIAVQRVARLIGH